MIILLSNAVEKENGIYKEIKKERFQMILDQAKESGESQIIETEIPEGKIIEKVRFLETFEDLPNLFICEEIYLENKKGKRISLTKPAPKRTFYINLMYNKELWPLLKEEINKESFFSDHILGKDNKIRSFIFYPGLEERGSRLSLFHEIYHARASRGEGAKEQAEAKDNLEGEIEEAVAKKCRRALKDEILIIWKPIDEKPRPVSLETFVEYFKLVSREERDAWAFALKVFKKLRDKGFNIKPEFKSKDDIDEYIYGQYSLGAYELELREITPYDTKFRGLFSSEFWEKYYEKK